MTDVEFDIITQPQQSQRCEPLAPEAPEAEAEVDAEAHERDEPETAPDETTGASPGTAQACSDLGLSSLSANLDRLGIKPPGQS